MLSLNRFTDYQVQRTIHGAAFRFKSPVDKKVLTVIATTHGGWDHVSVSRLDRCPTWEEMSWVANKFFANNEYAMQLHVPQTEHINMHPYCLHWWRPQNTDIPLPDPPEVRVNGQ